MGNVDRGRRNLWALWGFLAVALVGVPAAYSETNSAAPDPTDREASLYGDYLAGRIARGDHDAEAAAKFYSDALDKDPGNDIILEQAFLLEAATANWDKALPLAQRLVKVEPSHRIARFLLGCQAFKEGKYQEADDDFAQARQGPIADLTSTLARAWVLQAEGKSDDALSTLDSLGDADWAQFYQHYHRGLIADLAGKHDVAEDAFSGAFKRNPGTLRIAEAYARHLVNTTSTRSYVVKQHTSLNALAHKLDVSASDLRKANPHVNLDKLRVGTSIVVPGNDEANRRLAVQALKLHILKSSGHPLSIALLQSINSGETPPYLVSNPNEGLAEVFYGVGDALAGEGGLDMGIIFLQFALYVEPNFPLAEVALAEAYENAHRYDLELSAFNDIPEASPLWLNVQIQKAFTLNALNRPDDAKVLLEQLIAKNPKDIRLLDALGNILRSHERYQEARDYYSRAIALLEKSGRMNKDNWALYYSRGVCNERLKNWPAAEADLKRALNLSPDESLVLNYLGYSWVDQNENMKTAIDYIRKAVKLKPDDGYYVDSLGWAYYKTGNLPAAVEQLEHAVELKSDDATINEHLGDAYWRIGRTLEAKYQWEQSLTLKPDDDQIPELRHKIASGLSDTPQTKAADRTPSLGQKAQE